MLNVSYRHLVLFLILELIDQCASAQVTAHYINVGQAASALVELPEGVIVIEAGGETTANDEDNSNSCTNATARAICPRQTCTKGSYNGTSTDFMADVTPNVSIIGAGNPATKTPGQFHAF